MSKKRILVCDDSQDNFVKFQRYLGDEYTLLWVTEPTRLIDDVASNKPIHALILDLGFPTGTDQTRSWRGHLVLPALFEKHPRLKVIVHSDIFQRGNESEGLAMARELTKFPGVVALLSGTDERSKVVFEVERATGGAKWLAGRRNELWLLHLSDLQFGSKSSVIESPTGLADSICDALAQVPRIQRKVNPEGNTLPGLSFLTGDIVERALPNEYGIAKQFVERLHQRLDDLGGPLLETRHGDSTIVVPGNHDVNQAILRSASLRREARDPIGPKGEKYDWIYDETVTKKALATDSSYLHRLAWLPFSEFDNCQNREWAFNPGYRIVDLSKEARCILVLVNSSRWSVDHTCDQAVVAEEIWLRIADDLQALDHGKEMLRLLLVHHSPDTDQASDRMYFKENSSDRSGWKNLLVDRCNFAACFCGHLHSDAISKLPSADSDRSIIVCRASTTRSANQPSNQVPQFHLVGFGEPDDVTSKFLSMWKLSFRWNASERKWDPTIDTTDEMSAPYAKYRLRY